MDWERIARTLVHPLAISILLQIEERGEPTSPTEIAERLELPVGRVSYHVRRLAEAELIVLDRVEPRRGALEHFYGPATARAV